MAGIRLAKENLSLGKDRIVIINSNSSRGRENVEKPFFLRKSGKKTGKAPVEWMWRTGGKKSGVLQFYTSPWKSGGGMWKKSGKEKRTEALVFHRFCGMWKAYPPGCVKSAVPDIFDDILHHGLGFGILFHVFLSFSGIRKALCSRQRAPSR